MRLETILVHGFKSFAEKTELKVFPGVTCIVGPNGCGKSNVADAIRWALGEQSPKTLRGTKMEDVIFHGSASRKMIGMAEVSLVFNNDGGLDVPWSEVAVARRLYRTGESEYLLNTNVCRLRDIQDLFAGTGVNPKAYALMDQDRLNHVLTAKPWERRVFIEEAAGIARYKQQRSETQGKLEATRLNLQRLRDVMEEVRRQLSSIERQARKAQQYKALQAERQALDLALLAADYAALAAQHEAVTREMESLRETEEQQRTRIATLTGRQALQAAAIQDTEYRLGDLRQSVQKIQGDAERLLERREQMGLQIQDLLAEEARLEEEIQGLAERRIALAAEREGKTRGLGEARGRHAEQDDEVRRWRRRSRPVGARSPSGGSASRRCASSRSAWRAPAPTSPGRAGSCASAGPRSTAAPTGWPPSWPPRVPRPTAWPPRGTGWRRRTGARAPSSRCSAPSSRRSRRRVGSGRACGPRRRRPWPGCG